MQLFLLRWGKDPYTEEYTNSKAVTSHQATADFETYFYEKSDYYIRGDATCFQACEYHLDESLNLTLVNSKKKVRLKKKPRVLNPTTEHNVPNIPKETKAPEGVATNTTPESITLNQWIVFTYNDAESTNF